MIDNFARSKDGGKTWELTTDAPIPGAIFGLSYAGSARRPPEDGRGHGTGRRGVDSR